MPNSLRKLDGRFGHLLGLRESTDQGALARKPGQVFGENDRETGPPWIFLNLHFRLERFENQIIVHIYKFMGG